MANMIVSIGGLIFAILPGFLPVIWLFKLTAMIWLFKLTVELSIK